MGGAASRNAQFDEAQKSFNRHERELLTDVFEKLSVEDTCSERPDRKVIKFEQFKDHVAWLLPKETAKRFFNEMSSVGNPRDQEQPSEHQVTKEALFILMHQVLKKSNEEKSRVFYSMIAEADCVVTSTDIEQFLILMLNCYITALKRTDVGSKWKLQTTKESCERFARMLIEELLGSKPHPSYVAIEEVYAWIRKLPLVGQLFKDVVVACIINPIGIIEGAHHGISEGCEESVEHVEFNKSNILVPCKLGINFSEVSTLLDIPSILAINHHLPAKRRHQWRLLFSSRIHGESFQAFVHQIVNQGPSLLVVKDTDGYIFGGFASKSWSFKSHFQGTNKCFLFTLSPTMAVYQPTEYNKNYMYLNMGMQTMPNGLGMGGQLNYFGLWLDESFGPGHSKAGPKCTTYGSPRLSKNEEFSIDTVEVWGVGIPPEANLKEKSVLDTEVEAKAFLEITGKKMHSEGYRELRDED